jgi:hypothetical protein
VQSQPVDEAMRERQTRAAAAADGELSAEEEAAALGDDL